MLQQLQQNVQLFSAAKNAQEVKDLTAALIDQEGNLRSLQGFLQASKEIVETYNNRWMAAEYDTAVASAQNARKWLEATQQAETLPYLRYQTANDRRVRQSHRPLNNVVRPVNDAFWDTYYPPNGWRCRCFAQQLSASEGERKHTKTLPTLDIPPVFKNNPGKSGIIFPNEHPYYQMRKGEWNSVKSTLNVD